MRKPGMGCNAAMERRIKLYWAKSRGLVRSLQRKKRETVPAGTQMQGDPGGLGNSRMWFCVAAASPPGRPKREMSLGTRPEPILSGQDCTLWAQRQHGKFQAREGQGKASFLTASGTVVGEQAKGTQSSYWLWHHFWCQTIED